MFNLYPYLNVNDLNLDWIITHFKEFIDEISSLEEWRQTHEVEYAELKAFETQLKNGQLPPKMYDAFREWFDKNALELVGNMVKFITVEVSDAGYIVFKLPSQWKELVFNTTGLDINTPLQPDYGHLTISY